MVLNKRKLNETFTLQPMTHTIEKASHNFNSPEQQQLIKNLAAKLKEIVDNCLNPPTSEIEIEAEENTTGYIEEITARVQKLNEALKQKYSLYEELKGIDSVGEGAQGGAFRIFDPYHGNSM